MRSVVLFAEDYGHTMVLQSLLARLAAEFTIQLMVREYSVTGGHGRVETELGQFVRDLQRSGDVFPDLVIVATDANCQKFRQRRKRLQAIVQPLGSVVVYCIPDPHVERWLLLDASAFKKVLGAGCQAPDRKCDQDRYKQLLSQAVRAAGQIPLLGGLEHASDIVHHMRLDHIASLDYSFRALHDDLRSFFRRWQTEEK